RIEERLAGVEANLSDTSRLQKTGRRKRGAACLEAEIGEAVEDNPGEVVEIANNEREEADIEGLLDETLHHVFVGAPGPEQPGESDIDDDEGRGQETDVALHQAKAGIDVSREGVEEGVDDADVIHRCGAPVRDGAGVFVGDVEAGTLGSNALGAEVSGRIVTGRAG